MARATIKTLAAELGLSVCTINKALTGKAGISEPTRRRVKATAQRLGYAPNRLARTLVRSLLTIGVVYPGAWPSHVRGLIAGARAKLAELSDYRVSAEYREAPGFRNGRAFSRAVQQMAKRPVSGLILTLGDYPEQQQRRIWAAAQRIPFVLLGGDVPAATSRLTCVWHDCRRCGRLAAELLRLFAVDRPWAIFIGRRHHPDHRLKIEGFLEDARRAGRRVAGSYETEDDPAKAYPAAQRLFMEHPDTGGIYIGTENAAGICEYLAQHRLAGKVKVVATGHSEVVRQGMQKGLIQASLHQQQPRQGRLAVEALFQYLETGQRPLPEILVPPAVILRNNLDLWQDKTISV